MKDLLKDLISAAIYIFIAPFYRNKKAVLVYHSIAYRDRRGDPYKINVDPDFFEEQMKYLSKKKGCYVITFDDGYENIYSTAFPLLKRYGIKSMLFITTDFMDSKMNFNRFFAGSFQPAKSLSWAQVREMGDAGIEIGSHGLAHLDMAHVDKETARREASGSKSRIKEMTGLDASAFSYPFGNSRSYSEETARILKEAGYTRVYTNVMGMDNSGSEPFSIRRIRISGTDNMFRFKMKIAGACNWVDSVPSVFASRCKDGRF